MQHKIEESVIYAMLDFINIYLPFQNSEKGHTFEQEIESLVFKDKFMEATTIRELYIQRLDEQTQKRIKRINAKYQEAEKKYQEAEKKHQEAEKKHQEAEQKIIAAILNCSKQGFSAENIADMLLQPLQFVKETIDRK